MRARSMNILIVDDDSLIRDVLCRTVGYMGHTAIGACNGLDALDVIHGRVAIETNEPMIDLVISDCDMPTMSGPEMLAELKANPTFSHIPVIMISGDHDNSKTALGLGACAFLSKPFSTDVLVSEINRALAPEV